MTKTIAWRDEHWLLLMQLYLKSPQGLKPLYSRDLVALSLEIHVEPQQLYERMFRLRRLDTPRIERLWKKYSKHPGELERAVKLLRQMNGFGQPDTFYEGVELQESFERDFRQVGTDGDALSEEQRRLTPLMLILVLDLYYRLTPQTMVKDTPEVRELARLMGISPSLVVDVMECYQYLDPYLKRSDLFLDPLMGPCGEVWERFKEAPPQKLAALAAQMRDYFGTQPRRPRRTEDFM